MKHDFWGEESESLGIFFGNLVEVGCGRKRSEKTQVAKAIASQGLRFWSRGEGCRRCLPAGMVSSDCMVFLKCCQHLDIGSYNSKIKNSDSSWKNSEDLAQLDQNSLMATAKWCRLPVTGRCYIHLGSPIISFICFASLDPLKKMLRVIILVNLIAVNDRHFLLGALQGEDATPEWCPRPCPCSSRLAISLSCSGSWWFCSMRWGLVAWKIPVGKPLC